LIFVLSAHRGRQKSAAHAEAGPEPIRHRHLQWRGGYHYRCAYSDHLRFCNVPLFVPGTENRSRGVRHCGRQPGRAYMRQPPPSSFWPFKQHCQRIIRTRTSSAHVVEEIEIEISKYVCVLVCVDAQIRTGNGPIIKLSSDQKLGGIPARCSSSTLSACSYCHQYRLIAAAFPKCPGTRP
jgi:hypothetical protein